MDPTFLVAEKNYVCMYIHTYKRISNRPSSAESFASRVVHPTECFKICQQDRLLAVILQKDHDVCSGRTKKYCEGSSVPVLEESSGGDKV